ncbi:MAG: hypothetical protein BMS9Abin01_2489 [Gammaproteobacteria bacterium]|nr:MAG: hypothetical protein BMS9Abin01_2489 [Gammaproteobacteria bacterium]
MNRGVLLARRRDIEKLLGERRRGHAALAGLGLDVELEQKLVSERLASLVVLQVEIVEPGAQLR